MQSHVSTALAGVPSPETPLGDPVGTRSGRRSTLGVPMDSVCSKAPVSVDLKCSQRLVADCRL